MKVVITAATQGEWMPSYSNINQLYTGGNERLQVSFHQSGVGMLGTAVSLTRLVYDKRPDLIIQAGIAGTFDTNMQLGKVLAVGKESLGDMGVLENGIWKDVFDMQLEQADCPPYEKGSLPNPWLSQYNLENLVEVNSITINEISTDPNRIEQLLKKYNPVIESMEGAALHYVCRQMNVPFMQVRALSNYVGERDKTKWQIKLAINNLNDVLLKLIDKLYTKQ